MGRWYTAILVSCLASLLVPLMAQAAPPLTLEASLQLARKHNPLLQTIQWDHTIARENQRQADSSLYPRIDAQGGYTAQLEPQAMRVNGQTMETQQPSYASASLSVTQTIYDFGRRDARQRQAQANLDAVGAGIRSQEQEVSLQVIEAYFGVLEGEKFVLTAEEELRSMEEHRRVAQALYENGVVTRNDLLQAEVRLASSRQKLLMARNQVTNLYLRLNFLIGMPPETRQQLIEPPIVQTKPETAADLNAALQNRPDLMALQRQLDASDQQVRENKAAFYPELFARLSLDYLENEKVREQSIYAAMIGMKINLFDGFATTAVRDKAVAARARIQQQLRMAEQQARLEIATSQNDLQVADERITVTRETIRQGEENLRINKDRYQERVGTATDVLDAQSLLTQARTEHYQAVYDFQVARARLNKALGLL